MNCKHAAWSQSEKSPSGWYVATCTTCGAKSYGSVVVTAAEVLAARIALGLEVAPC